MDYYNQCQCENCRAMNEQYQTDGGTQFWFVNELARRTSEVYPNKLIGTLAYMYTEEPPVGMKMHPNVAVWLCHMYPSCDTHPIRTCPDNADFKRRAEAWAQITDHLYMWHYIVDFMHYYSPFLNLYTLANNIRLSRHRCRGISCGMGHRWWGIKPLGRVYLLWRQTWTHQADQAVPEGLLWACWGPIYWITLLQKQGRRQGIHLHLCSNPEPAIYPRKRRPARRYLTKPHDSQGRCGS